VLSCHHEKIHTFFGNKSLLLTVKSYVSFNAEDLYKI
jgi:hypothetical protein